MAGAEVGGWALSLYQLFFSYQKAFRNSLLLVG
jgi:hypothetical protein